jgi:hypothetical protein
MLLRWKKMESLVNFDPAWWLHESFRLAKGEFPYRDFGWLYPPLSLWMIGLPLRWFGISFDVVQITLDAISLPVVFLSYALLRHIMTRRFALLTCLLLIAICATARTYFVLFSMVPYTPAMIVAASGLLLFLLGAVRYLRSGVLDRRAVLYMGVGSLVGMLSKQEPILAIGLSLVVMALADRKLWFRDRPTKAWMMHYLGLGMVCLLPTVMVDAWLISKVGAAQFVDALKGYGLGTTACPYWPTGLGIFGALSALGAATTVAAASSLAKRKEFIAALGGKTYRLLWIFSAVGISLHVGYEANVEGVFTNFAGIFRKIAVVLPALGGSGAVLRPVMWVSLLYWFWLCYTVWREHSESLDYGELVTLLVLMTAPVSMSIRGLFGSNITPYPEAPAICYPFFVLLGPYLLIRFLQRSGRPFRLFVVPDRATAAATTGVILTYMLIRIVGGYPLLFSRSFHPLSTTAGTVFLRDRDYEKNREIYDYVMQHTSESDTILDGPYGGGMHFATGRRSPTFSTFFRFVPTPEKYLDLDLARVRQSPPKVAIFDNDTDFGMVWGIPYNVACVFPRLVWIPDQPASKPIPIPLVSYLRENYRIEKIIGDKVILVPKT